MLVLIYGGSGSGKSAYAEDLAVQLADGPLYYMATMVDCDEECSTRILRHQQQREQKGFFTLEQSVDLFQCVMPEKGTILLECLPTLLTNEYYRLDEVDYPQQKVWQELLQLASRCHNLLIVSSNVFADGVCYDAETEAYIQTLGWLHQQLAQVADLVVEIVVGLPMVQKGVL